MPSFKRAFVRCLIFLLAVMCVNAVICWPYFHGEVYHYQDGYVRDSLAGKLDLLICGASQAKRGISPAILNEELGCSSYNMGSPLMTMKSRYNLLKKELERNPVDTVIVELCYDTMVRDRDKVGREGDYYMLGRLTSPWERMAFFLDNARLEEYLEFYYDTLNRGIQSWKQWEHKKIGTSESYQTLGFVPLGSNAVALPEREAWNREAILTQIVPENRLYLEKILELCREREIRAVMVCTPLSDGAILSYDALEEIQSFYLEIAGKWDCEYYNFSLYPNKSDLFPDSTAFYDRNHLSYAGAETFTRLLCQVLRGEGETFYESYAQAQGEIGKRYEAMTP